MFLLKTPEKDKTHEFRISVVIPTFNRQDILERTLKALEEQTLPKKYFEVVVVNDGSSDGTHDFLERYKNRGALNFTYIQKENEGQGIARNTALSHTDGIVILFLGDDHIPEPTLLEEHWKVHERYFTENFICLGHTTWHHELVINPCMQFLEYIGFQFKYGAMQKFPLIDKEYHLRIATYKFFYTGNISVKRSLFEKYQFDTRFKKYGWEDIELGLRMQYDEGAIILYSEKAKALHYHSMELEPTLKRMEQVGKSAKLAKKINPRLRVTPVWWKHIIFWFISRKPLLSILKNFSDKALEPSVNQLPFYTKCYYYALMKRHFLIGLSKK